MAWSEALYYPWIQVRDLGWLKNAVLYWDVVSTIVPGDRPTPYTHDDERALADEGWLRPLWIGDGEPSVERASRGTLKLIEDSDIRIRLSRGKESATGEGVGGFGRLLEEISFGKYNVDLQTTLKRYELFVEGRHGGWPSVNRAVFDLHMTHLAHYLAVDRHLALVTDDHGLSPITDSLALGRPLPASARSGQTLVPMTDLAKNFEGYDYKNMTSGVLSRYVFRTIGVTAETPVRDLIAFRHRHIAEIGRLRAALDELAGKIDSDFPSREAFEQTVLDVFRNAVRPALAELEQAKRARIPKLAPSLLNAGLLTSAPTWVGPVQSYLNTTGRLLAIAAMAGMSLTAIAVKHNAERRAELGKDPYGFLLAARERFGHGPEWNARQRWWRPGQVRRPY